MIDPIERISSKIMIYYDNKASLIKFSSQCVSNVSYYASHAITLRKCILLFCV